MNDTHGLENVPDLPSFSFQRMGGSVTIEPCPDGQQWHWTWYPDEIPAVMQVPTGYIDIQDGQPVMQDVEWEPTVIHIHTHNLLTNLTPDEARLFLGWCSHLHEQCGAHLSYLADAVKQAIDERRWEGLTALIEELHMASGIRAHIEHAGRVALELT